MRVCKINCVKDLLLGVCEVLLGQKENACSDFERKKALGDVNAAAYISKYCK